MVRAVVAILLRGAAELRHGNENDVFHAITHVLAKRRQCRAELPQELRHLLLLVLMIIELLHTVRSSIQSHQLEWEPFLIVGAMAGG